MRQFSQTNAVPYVALNRKTCGNNAVKFILICFGLVHSDILQLVL